jgi:Tol biopolymer transport system component
MLSPDFETLLICRDKGLFLKPVYGGAERLLARVEGFEMGSEFWHPSGARIGIQRRMSGRSQLWEIRTGGTGLRPLVPEFTADQCCGGWSPDGRRLYFISQDDIYLQGSRHWLGWMRRRVPMRLTSGPMHFLTPNEDPANPLVIYAVGGVAQATAMKLDRKTNVWEPFLEGLAADEINSSPDGQWIAYVAPNAELWKCRKDGSGKVLLEDGLVTTFPRWSPDGSRISFAGRDRQSDFSAGPSNPFHIYTISAGGGKAAPAPGVQGPAGDPTWSPDGKRLVYSPYPYDVPKERQHVSIVSLETGTVEDVPGSDNLFSTRWSPDGKWLVALTCDKLWPYVYSFATQKWTLLHAGAALWPNWSRDSRFVYFTQRTPESRLVRMEVATGRVEEIRKLSEFPIGGVFEGGAFWTSDEEPVVLKGVSSSQIYRIERDR